MVYTSLIPDVRQKGIQEVGKGNRSVRKRVISSGVTVTSRGDGRFYYHITRGGADNKGCAPMKNILKYVEYLDDCDAKKKQG